MAKAKKESGNGAVETLERIHVLPGQLIVEVDPIDLGEKESVSDGGIVKPVGAGKQKGPEAIKGVVIESGIEEVGAGCTVIFDFPDGFRFEHGGMVLMSLYRDHVRAFTE